MSGIRGKDTRPEMLIRLGLFSRGFRYRIHGKNLPGKPDVVLPKHHVVVFVNGCFWHGHDCSLFRWPSSNVDFWRAKIMRNSELDHKNVQALRRLGWRVLTVWECAIKGPSCRPLADVLRCASEWIRSGSPRREIKGQTRSMRAIQR
jgi:DNA mismatch endonuclease, patch repair protein